MHIGETEIKRMAESVKTLVLGECNFEYITAAHLVLNKAGVPQKDKGYYINLIASESGLASN